MNRSPNILVRKYAILVHRWLGVCFSILFLVWFVSGIVMMYCDFPGVTQADRLAHSPPIAASTVRITPMEAYMALETDEAPDRVRISTLAGRPIYRFQFGRDLLSVFADTAESLDEVSAPLAQRIAGAWVGQPETQATIQAVTQPDQWTVGLARAGQLWKSTWPSGEEVYVSRRTGEVVQFTTRASRIGAWCGAIPHWLYFTPLRKDGRTWSNVVIYSSAVGTFLSLLGLVVGLWLYSPSAHRYHFPTGASSIPYTGQKRRHMILGLAFGVFSVTWVFSGMLSMEPSFWPSGDPLTAPARSLRSGPWQAEAFSRLSPRDVLLERSFKELELARILGEPTYIARESASHSQLIRVTGSGLPTAFDEIDNNAIIRTVALAAKPFGVAESRRVTQYEAYYVDRHGRKPLPVLFMKLTDPQETTYYVDPKTALLVQSYDSRSRVNRWLYHGFHSMDLPWLYENRPAWDLTVLFLMAGGTALSVTSVVIGWRRLRRKVRDTNAVLGV